MKGVTAALLALATGLQLATATHYPGLGLHNDDQKNLAINNIPAADREYYMAIANDAVREINGDACSIAPFGSVVVDHKPDGTDEIVCVAANQVGVVGDPSMHGEMTAIRVCTEVLKNRGLSPQEMLLAWRNFTMYTNGEPCPMCASALRWSGLKEVVWGTSIETIIKHGRSQIYLPSSLIVSASYALGHQTLWIGSILEHETDKNFAYQFNETAPCPRDCHRELLPGKRVSQCVMDKGWRQGWLQRKGQWEANIEPRGLKHAHTTHNHGAHDEL
ncbi:hypothetical protein OIO90_004231 [Microbotryomycetes sp. JL221]|nr:hypothetical protein OIO90_004231 [Microbotryomycetes sp. JL221]